MAAVMDKGAQVLALAGKPGYSAHGRVASWPKIE